MHNQKEVWNQLSPEAQVIAAFLRDLENSLANTMPLDLLQTFLNEKGLTIQQIEEGMNNLDQSGVLERLTFLQIHQEIAEREPHVTLEADKQNITETERQALEALNQLNKYSERPETRRGWQVAKYFRLAPNFAENIKDQE